MVSEVDCGSIEILGSAIRYQSRNYQEWNCQLDDVAVIGQYTTAEGPAWPDHFVTFVLWEGRRNDAPVEAVGMAEVLETLEAHVGLEPASLAGSTGMCSVIQWPKSLRGRQLVDFLPEPRTFTERVVRFWETTYRIELTAVVQAYLTSAESDSC